MCNSKIGVPMNLIFPVKNYHEETQTNDVADVLILNAFQQIVCTANERLSHGFSHCSDQLKIMINYLKHAIILVGVIYSMMHYSLPFKMAHTHSMTVRILTSWLCHISKNVCLIEKKKKHYKTLYSVKYKTR